MGYSCNCASFLFGTRITINHNPAGQFTELWPVLRKSIIISFAFFTFLLLNVKKTNEMIIDFRRNKNPLTPVLINKEEVERVESYKNLGVTLDNVLKWNPHIMTLLKKLNTRLYFSRTLNSFHVDKTLLCTFYKAIVESVICFALTCWGGNSNKFLTNKIDVIIDKCNRLCQVSPPLMFCIYANVRVKSSLF